MTGMGVEAGAQAARSRALAVLRIRSRALAVALLPAALAVILLTGGSTDHLVGRGWDLARWSVSSVSVVVLLAAGGIALVVARARPAVSPTVPIAEESAPDLYRMVRDLADRLDVPVPSAIALTPDCDSWLEDRTHPAHGPPPREDRDEIAGGRGLTPARSRRAAASPVLVIGSPFLWWMRVGELRAVLAPVVAGTGPSAHPDIAAARRFVRGLDAAVAVASAPRGPVPRAVLAGVGWVARLLLRSCRVHAAEMERGVAAAAAERAQAVDYGLRIVAQEQVGLAYAGWDRLLTRVALPAWRMGRWPSRLDAGVVAALTELSRRDRLAEGFASRLGERPACDLLEEPGTVDEAASLLAARLFHGGPAESGPDWSPVDWQEYPEEVVDRKWRTDAARLHRVLDTLGVTRSTDPTTRGADAPTLARVLNHLTAPAALHAGTGMAVTDTETAAMGTRTAAVDTVTDAMDAYGAATTDGMPTEPAASDPRTVTDATDPRTTTVANPVAPHPGTSDPGTSDTDTAAAESPSPVTPALDATDPHTTATADLGVGCPDTSDVDAPAAQPSSPGTPALDTTDPHGIDPNTTAANSGALHSSASHSSASHSGASHSGASDAESSAPESPTPGAPAVDDNAPEPLQTPQSIQPPDAAHPVPHRPHPAPYEAMARDDDEEFAEGGSPRSAALAAGLTAELAREEAAAPATGTGAASPGQGPDTALWDDGSLPLFPLQPPRTGRELLADHVTAMVCCAAVDTAGATPGLDWLDGPSLLVNGERAADLTPRVLSLVEDGDPAPLRAWLVALGIRPEKPVRLV